MSFVPNLFGEVRLPRPLGSRARRRLTIQRRMQANRRWLRVVGLAIREALP